MISIKSREDANKYYKIVNEVIDDFIKQSQARPLEVYNYIKKNISRFLEKNQLSTVVGIERIVRDIIDHRKALEMDKIVTFESYRKLFEDFDLKSNNIRKEKILADYFHTSSGHVSVINQDLNIYIVDDFGKKIILSMLSPEDMKLVKLKFKNFLKDRMLKKVINFDNIILDFKAESDNISLSELVDDVKVSNYLDSVIGDDSSINFFKSYVNNLGILDFEIKKLESIDNFGGYLILKVQS